MIIPESNPKIIFYKKKRKESKNRRERGLHTSNSPTTPQPSDQRPTKQPLTMAKDSTINQTKDVERDMALLSLRLSLCGCTCCPDTQPLGRACPDSGRRSHASRNGLKRPPVPCYLILNIHVEHCIGIALAKYTLSISKDVIGELC